MTNPLSFSLNFRSIHQEDDNISTKPDLKKITLDESETEKLKEENTKDTSGVYFVVICHFKIMAKNKFSKNLNFPENLTFEQEVYKELETKLKEAIGKSILLIQNFTSRWLTYRNQLNLCFFQP